MNNENAADNQAAAGSAGATGGASGAGGDPENPFKRSKFSRANKATTEAAKAKTEVCPYCGERPPSTLDHIKALKDIWESGGKEMTREVRSRLANDLRNLIGACKSCNSAKQSSELGPGVGQWWPKAWNDWWPFGGP
ncbi:hypothetical protein GCM10023346_31250 [Arthrobacter gyeryongensis]|uniref:HNH nuclease domain-containing protein n=1 Tax=Arthrobacter gyeryongensis TaxID=1650592 RepID=A0ABP9SM67_9MICC